MPPAATSCNAAEITGRVIVFDRKPHAPPSIAATTHMSLDFRGPSLPASLTAQSCHTAYASVRVSREKAGTLSPREHFTVSGTTVTVDNVDSTSRLTLVLPRSLSSLRLNYGSWSTDIVAACRCKLYALP